MGKLPIVFAALLCLALGCTTQPGKHLFILSGQSNMVGLDPGLSFTPTVSAHYGADRVLVVKDAEGGQPIRRWYKEWQAADGTKPDNAGDRYDSLMTKVKQAIQGEHLETVTFIWMQGERDAREQQGAVYAASLEGLLAQLRTDLNDQSLFFVIGRLSDFDLANARYPHWTLVREAQMQVANNTPYGAWIDTDDLNDGLNRRGQPMANDLHYSVEGYRTLGLRFAKAALALHTPGSQ